MLAVKRHKALETLANDIQSDGVNIDTGDIEKIVDLYERIVITMTNGCDNTKVLDAYIDPYASIDFGSMEEEGIDSLRQFAISIDELSKDEKFVDNISPLENSTMNAILDGDNIVIALKHVQEFMHFIGSIAEQFVKDTKECSYGVFRFTSYPARGHMTISAYNLGEKGIAYKYTNSSLINRDCKE